MVELFVNDKLE